MGPLQLVAMTGNAMLIASTCGRPQPENLNKLNEINQGNEILPSPLLGKTKAFDALYKRGNRE